MAKDSVYKIGIIISRMAIDLGKRGLGYEYVMIAYMKA